MAATGTQPDVVTRAVEIERKYDAEPGFEPALDGLPGVVAVTEPERLDLEAVYYDTDDLRLARDRVTLRRRGGGQDDGWHLKLPASEDGERIELRLPAADGSTEPPRELVDLTSASTRGAPLRPVARLNTTRYQRRLLGGDGQVLAEVVSDDVTGARAGDPGAPDRWHELEVELVDGPRELLDAVDERLRAAGVRRSASASKVARVLGTQAAAPQRHSGQPSPSGAEAAAPQRHSGQSSPSGAEAAAPQRHSGQSSPSGAEAAALPRHGGEPSTDGGGPSAGDAVLDYLRAQLERLRRQDPRVRRDEPDAVHDMRVAARRARSTLQAFRAVLDRAHTDGLVEELSWLGQVLAGPRDAEVQRVLLLRKARALPAELLLGPVVARIDAHCARRRAEARRAALAELRGPRYLALLDRLHRLEHDPPLTPLAARPAREVLASLARGAHRRVRRRMKRYDPSGAGRDSVLHEARKAAKRARYAAEVAAPIMGRPARRSAKRLKKLQSLLGDHHDAVVAGPLLRDLGTRAHLDGENGFTFGLLLGQLHEQAAGLRERVPAVWRRADSRKTRRWMS